MTQDGVWRGAGVRVATAGLNQLTNVRNKYLNFEPHYDSYCCTGNKHSNSYFMYFNLRLYSMAFKSVPTISI